MTGAADPPAEAIALTGVSVFYGEVVGLSGVTVGFGPGITGIVGPNGSGKTTLMRLLTGLIAPGEGAVRVLGEAPFSSATARARVGFVPATENLFDEVSGLRNARIAFLARGLDSGAAAARAERAMAIAGLERDARRRYRTWSRGMRQRLKVGICLAADVDVVLLDEPFLGVDPPNRHKLRALIADLAGTGRAVLVSSHVLHEVESITDTVAILNRGRLLGHGRVADLLARLRDQHPHRIHIDADMPRRLARALVDVEHVREIALDGEGGLEFVTVEPERAYADLPRLVADIGCAVRSLRTEDDGLEAVFRHMTEAGVRQL